VGYIKNLAKNQKKKEERKKTLGLSSLEPTISYYKVE
jgi:hypothetical protein